MYDLEEERLFEEITKHGARRILIQLPEGLKREGLKLSKLVENKTKAEAFLSADPCYGACDIAFDEALSLKADLIIHYGHTALINQAKIPVIYFHAPLKSDVTEVLKKVFPTLSNMKKIGLATTIQHIQELGKAKAFLEESGLEVFIGKKSGAAQFNGQILGCDYSTAKTVSDSVDGFLFIGGGNFHPLGLAMETGKKVIVADPYRKEIIELEELTRKTYRQRWIAIEQARKAKTFGIIIGLKPGQKRVKEALRARERLKRAGKETALLVAKEINLQNLANFQDIEAFIITACPRLAVDDSQKISKPILTERELAVMIGDEPWEKYVKE